MTNTKKTLNWKLKEQPSGHVVAELVASKVITPDEGREILFGNREYDLDKMKALEEQVEFLQGLVKELAKSKVTNISYTYPKPLTYLNTPYWKATDTMLCSSGLGTVYNTADNQLEVMNIDTGVTGKLNIATVGSSFGNNIV